MCKNNNGDGEKKKNTDWQAHDHYWQIIAEQKQTNNGF